MAADDRIAALYDSTLRPRLAALESLRLELRGYVRKAAVAVGVPAVALWGHSLFQVFLPDAIAWATPIVAFVALLVGVVFAGVKYLMPGVAAYVNYRSRFKHEVAAEVFKIVCPSATYAPDQGIAKEVFDEPGLFNTRGSYSSDDRVRGTIGKTPFEAADVSRKYSTGGKNSRTVVVFRGLFFHLDFNKQLRGTTVVDPAGAAGTTLGPRDTLTRVALENEAFSRAFTVWSTDEVEARYILTPAMMEQVLVLQARTAKPLHLAFEGRRAYLGINYGRALFEPGIAETTSLEAIQEMAAHFALADAIVHELDLNTRIWTKDVDDSLLHAPDAAPGDSPLDRVFATGNLTPEALWKAATDAAGMSDPEEPGVAAPPGTAIAIDRGPGTLTVHDGLPLTFYIALAIWVASLLVTLAAVRRLPDEWPSTRDLVAAIPEIPYASAWVASAPLVWLGVAVVAGSIAFLFWALRVRRVEVSADAVRTWRGLRPWPRVYPRPPYGKVVRVENAVFIGKTTGWHLVNPSASPTLRVDEARWVASELRQALR